MLLTKDNDAGPYTPIKLRRSPHRTSPSSVGSVVSNNLGPLSMAGSSRGYESASKALSTDFGYDHAMDNLRTQMASRKEKEKEKEKMKQVAEGSNKSQSSQGGPLKDAKKGTIDNEGRKLTRLID